MFLARIFALRKRSLILILATFFFLFIAAKYFYISGYNGTSNDVGEQNQKRLVIIVPFRDRMDELLVFVPRISEFLRAQNIKNYRIAVVNQSPQFRFNRGALINIGYKLVNNSSDYIAIHDVDLIPLNKNISYTYPKYGPLHLASPHYHPLYNYEKYLGGILLITNEHFERLNGMSNIYYGWGMEDDEFFLRIKTSGLPIFRPTSLSTNKNNTFLHLHESTRKRDTSKTLIQTEVSKRFNKTNGLSNIQFHSSGKHCLSLDNKYEFDIYNVDIICDTDETPWCLRKNH